MIKLFAVAICVAGFAAPLRQTSTVELRTFFRPADYIAPQFADPPMSGASYLFFDGESVSFDVIVSNRDTPVRVRRASLDDVQLSVSTDGGRNSTALGGNTWSVDAPVIQLAGAADLELDGGTWFDLPVNAVVAWHVQLSREMSSRQHGLVEITATAALACETPCRAVPGSNVFRYERRKIATEREMLEQHYRVALMAYREGRYSEADDALSDLFKLYPVSVVGYTMRARIAEKMGRRDVAISAYNRVISLLTNGSDKILLEHTSAKVARELLATTRGQVAALRDVR